ncbi:MAG: MEDS domain-containing protein, partial [Pyrinomonadaceae bacterium]
GIDIVGDVHWGTHFCHFYETKKDLLDLLIPYFKTGLENNELCIWVVFEPLDEAEAREVLRHAVPEAERHLAAGDIEIIPYAEWYLKDGAFDLHVVIDKWKDKLSQALSRGYDGIRAGGIETWLTEKVWKNFAEYEKELDNLITNRKMIVLCTYPVEKSSAAGIFDVARSHQFTIALREGNQEILETPELKQAKHTIKTLNEELELRVNVRTAELAASNEELKNEIIERRRIEAAEKESRQMYESLVQSIDGIIWEANPESFQLTFVSKQAERILGYPLPQWLTTNFWENHLHPDDRVWAVDFCMKAAARREAHQLEYRMIAADGQIVWLKDFVTVEISADGSVLLRGVMVNITEQKDAAENVLKEKYLTEALLKSLPGIFYLYDEQGQYLRWNENLERVTGWSAGEIVRMHPLDKIAAEDKARATKCIKAVFTNGQSSLEANLLTKDGRRIPYFFTGQRVIVDEKPCLIGVGIDIAERERAEQENQKLLSALSERVKELTALHHASYILQQDWANPQAILRDIAEILPPAFHYPEITASRIRLGEIEAVTEGFTDLPTALRAGFITSDGQAGSIEVVYVKAIPNRAEPLFLIEEKSLIDTLANMLQSSYDGWKSQKKLRQSEHQLAEAQKLAHFGSWNWDIETNTLTWSDEVYRIFGIEPQKRDTNFESYLEVLHPEDGDFILNIVNNSGEQNEPFSYYYRIIRPDGQVRILYAHRNVVTDEDGNPVRTFGTVQDVTERVQAEEQLKSSNEKLRALAARVQAVREEQSIMIAREIHDELGSALTGLKMDISWSNKHLPAEGGEPLRQKFAEMSQLIDETIQKVRNISTELRPSILDDLGLAAAIEWQCREFQRRTEIKCRITSLYEDAELGPEKATAVFRIYQEILTNAARHSRATLVETSMEKNGENLILKVSDDGVGIKGNDISDSKSLGILGIFERAAVFGGNVKIDGTEGKGTTVTVSIPLE